MFIKIFLFIFLIYCKTITCVHTYDSEPIDIVLEPTINLVYNDDQSIALKCCIGTTCSHNNSFDCQNIEVAIGYQENLKLLNEPEITNSSYSCKGLNQTYRELRSTFNINDQSFRLNCIAFVESNRFGRSYAQFIYSKDKEFCSEQKPCNTSANLVCSPKNRCECGPNYINIAINNSVDHKCFPKVGYNESCIDDRQCQAMDWNSRCGLFDGISKRCLCFDYYAFDGIQCYTSWSDWLCLQWSGHRFQIIVILILIIIGLSILITVVSISLHLRAKSSNPANDVDTFKYPNSLTPKVVVSTYFCNIDSEDEKRFKPFDGISQTKT